MPKKKQDTLPIERQLYIFDCIQKAGSLDRKEIELKVLNRFEVTEGATLKKMIQRDLDSLVKSLKINMKYLDRYEQEVPFESDEKYKAIYYCSNNENNLIGQKQLNELGISLYTSPILQSSVSVRSNKDDQSSNNSFYFSFPSLTYSYHLEINQDAIPFKLVLGRLPDKSESDLDKVLKEISKRCIYINIQSREISSYKNANQPGHLCIEVQPNKILKIIDFNSTNGSKVSKLINVDLNKLESLLSKTSETIKSITNLKLDDFENLKSTPGFFELPLFMILGSNFPVIIK